MDAGALSNTMSTAIAAIRAELQRANEKFAMFKTQEEGWAVILEEIDELWEHVRKNTGRTLPAAAEAVQIGAMAAKMMMSVHGFTEAEAMECISGAATWVREVHGPHDGWAMIRVKASWLWHWICTERLGAGHYIYSAEVGGAAARYLSLLFTQEQLMELLSTRRHRV